MNLVSLRLRRFRNIDALDQEFGPARHVIYGPNAYGKTSVLEAIHLLALGRSHRTTRDTEVIQYGAGGAYVCGRFQDENQAVSEIEIAITPAGKRLRINHTVVPRLSALLGKVLLVILTPDDLKLVRGAPSHRRRWLDAAISTLDVTYLKRLQEYQHVLKQRNVVLRGRHLGGFDPKLLEVLDQSIVPAGTDVVLARYDFLREFDRHFRSIYASLCANVETADVFYASRVADGPSLKENYERRFEASRAEDFRYATTSFGPHRDDLRLRINGEDAHRFASQGQARTLAIALRLAQMAMIRRRVRRMPIILVDDLPSALDANRASNLLRLLPADGQVFITSTERRYAEEFVGEATYWKLENGKLTLRS